MRFGFGIDFGFGFGFVGFSLWFSIILVGGCSSWRLAEELPPSNTDAGSGGLPCDIETILAPCRSCHGAIPTSKAPMSIVTWADLVSPAPSDPTKSVAALSIERMASATDPMPPAPDAPLSAADQAAFATWVDAGMVKGDCSAAPDPLNAAPTCTSDRYSFVDEGSTMEPGGACISCHAVERGPRFTIAGTVFPTGHEPDRCVGASGGAQVIITDANGVDLRAMTPNSVGNFYLSSRTSVVLPYTARVVANGKTRRMTTPQTDGDCNSCHTQSGDNDAPGRITLPPP